jgi:signal transduction histidine kinase/CheY-like chemotaxis protein/PAS domain-containing protein
MKRPLIESGELVQSGALSTSWLGVPLRTKEIIGVIAVQSYDEETILTADHLDILSRLAPQIANVIDKVRAEDALITNEAQLTEALQLARMGYWELDPISGNYTLSDEVFTMLNMTAEEMGGHILPADRFTQEVVHPNYFAPLNALIQEAYQTQDPDFNAQTETCFYTRDRKIIWVFVRFKVVKDQDGKTVKLVGSVQDISARKEIEDALRRQNEYLATATEVGRLITSTLDLDTLFNRTVDLIKTRFNYNFVSIFTVDSTGRNAVLREGAGLVGQEMKVRKHTLSVGSKSIIGTVTAEGSTMVVNNTATNPIHRPNPLLPETRAEMGIPLKIGSRILGALDIQSKEVNAFHPEDIAVLETLADQIAVSLDNANSYDLAQKAVAEMRELDRIKSQFLANMSHELRTPLNSIIGFSRVILKGIDGPVSEQQHQDLSAIYNSGQHLLGLINDILDLSKIEAGKMELSVEELNLSDTVNSVMSTSQGLVKDKPIKLKSEIEPGIPTVRADPMRIRQILLNLISNAAKFTDEGSITITAHTQTGPKGIQEIWVGITDTGSGISPEDQLKLFQAFSQVDASPTRKTGGSGLGLSICQQMIKLHGGNIGVNSTVGKGSTFYFTLPLFHQPTTEQNSGEGRIILCIDDDPQVISLYERYLQPQGYKVVPVANPANARDTAKRIKPYAITLDIMMPDVDGWTVLEQLKNDADTRNIPVIVCSIVEEEEKGFSLGAADYLVKPILEEDLVIALNRLNSDGAIKEVLIIDDSLDDLRLMEKILNDHSTFHPILAEGGEAGWNMLTKQTPDAVILDLFMPDLDGFKILERLRTTPELRDLPVIVVSGMDLTVEQKKQLEDLGKHMLQKGMLNEKELFSTLEKALKRLESR